MLSNREEVKSIFERDGYRIITPDDRTGDSFDLKQKKSINDDSFGAKDVIRRTGTLAVGDVVKMIPDGEHDIPTIVEYLNWHMNNISQAVIGREDIIRQAIFAILTGEHMLLLSRTGMAKSYLASSIFNIFEGARVFSSQASKDQTPDNYFGPYNIEEFRKGRIRHNIKGSIIEANLVFLDEFFDASDVVLRSLLSVLNERKFINGSEQIDAVVHTAIATANYMRMNEVTEAVLDRFTYKAIIPEDNNVYNQLLIDETYTAKRGKPVDPDKKIYFNQILFLNEIITNNHRDIKVNVPDFIYFMKNVFITKYISEMRKNDSKFFISPRKQAKLGDFLRASAIINNRFEVTMDDLRDMHIALCTLNSFVSMKNMDKSEKDLYLDVFQKTMNHFKANGALAQIEFLLNIRKIFEEIKSDPDKREQILKKSSLLEGLKNLLKMVFAGRRREGEEENLTLEYLKKSVFEVNSSVEEVNELKNGILKDYRDLM
ncbi:MAG: ATPase RavA [Spirochaetes bacterium ADurb.Bin218]|jgi:MoxR-like ATPase|nr:MoxR family ATPase [Spirochaetota bacterium]OQA98576.1 MAG: ATPase RavA [Spirochaetes bacterium ADurb.Bin218]HOQ10977.1 AAA family ATPase [Spirochaetota bacterium]HOV08848.1 AAA family ATPase [Spirochaetota bacterium]HPX91134.1 AAA family ATPase [Spirochaetota bacterium]